MEKILNLSKISEIFLEDKEAIQEVLDMLEETIPEFLVNLQQDMEAENLPQFKFTIHKFKSSCQLLTDPAFIELIRTIEHTDADKISDILPFVDQLKIWVRQLQKEIEDYKKSAISDPTQQGNRF